MSDCGVKMSESIPCCSGGVGRLHCVVDQNFEEWTRIGREDYIRRPTFKIVKPKYNFKENYEYVTDNLLRHTVRSKGRFDTMVIVNQSITRQKTFSYCLAQS